MKKSIQIPLAKPFLSDDDVSSAAEVLRSGNLVCGSVVEAFEQELAAFLDVQHVVAVSSGTAALQLGLLALGIGPGDEVIVPAFSFPATANAIELVGARCLFVDCRQRDFNLDVASIENKITTRTKAIIVVHNFGWPADIAPVLELSAKYGLPLFEDAACALGSSTRGKKCGSLGTLAAFSFHPRKIVTTGEGGALATKDPDVAERAKELRNHGQRLGKPGDFVSPGFNYRMTEFQAALGLSQMKRLNETLHLRRQAARYYDHAISRLPSLELPLPPKKGAGEINYQAYVAYVREGVRDLLISHLREQGVEASLGTYAIPHTSYYQGKYGFSENDFPYAKYAYENLIALPLFETMSKRDQDTVVSAVEAFESGGVGKHKQPFSVC